MFDSLPKFVFFTGKGGVGKTSLACSSALNLADNNKKILLVSTDPASNVGQVFQAKIGNEITPINDVPGLDAIEINPEEAAAQYRERIVGPMRGILPEKTLQSIEEQLSGACTTEIAAFDEFTDLLTNADLARQYDHIVFDTAPTGHTIRLLKLPGAWTGFLETGTGDASCLGPLSGLEKQRERYAAAVDRLGDENLTRLILVARPHQSAMTELARTSAELAGIGIKNQHLAINGLMPDGDSSDPLATALSRKDQAALASMDPELAKLPRYTFSLRSENLVGTDALRRFASCANEVIAPQTEIEVEADLPTLDSLIGDMEQRGKGLVMFMGKGGVGKTTMAAAFATELAARGHDVLLTTTDPAAHLTETLGQNLPHLAVSRIDPEVEIARYREQVLTTKGKDLDAEGIAILEEDLRSPCTEEIAVFQAFSRAIRESTKKFVIMDTAPTGHTLLLLDATGSYHRDIIRHSASDGQPSKLVTPMMRLQDPEQTSIVIVTLPETTPVLEAEHLQNDLQRAGIHPSGWIINSSLSASETGHPLLRRRARSEIDQISKVRDDLAKRFAVVPMQHEEPVGIDKLRALFDSPKNLSLLSQQ
ncbi:MAG: arsenical pump-driving ATPase [Rhodospirillales bacterium]|nr:arsenical pump-driving ATPase [Rhodospirillales bacterium]